MLRTSVPSVGGARAPLVRLPMQYELYRRAAFGEVIRRRRENCGLDRYTVGRLTGLTTTELAGLEDRGELPTVDAVFCLADALGTDAAEFFHESRQLAEDLAVREWVRRRASRLGRRSTGPGPDRGADRDFDLG